MIVALEAYRNNMQAFSWYHEGVKYTLDTDGSVWIMYADGVTVRDSYGHPLSFAMEIDGKHYARNVLGHTFY
jgi:hypothetical protein